MFVPCSPSYLFNEHVNWHVTFVIVLLHSFGKWLITFLEFFLFGLRALLSVFVFHIL